MKSKVNAKAFFWSVLFPSLLLAGCGADNSAPFSPASQADLTPLERGQIIFKRCQACHTLGEGERHRVGPNLYGFYGAVAGSKGDFNYSRAMTQSDIVWTDETLDGYLTRPSDYMPGNRMSFIGLKKQEDRDAVIEYMKSKTGAN
jgi:cytochrome c